MDKSYTVNITNGVGSDQILNGTYSVTSNVVGYDNSTITPTSVEVNDSTTTLSFTVAATGALTIHITDNGTTSGTPIQGATLQRWDSVSNQLIGNVLTTDMNGNAVISNVAFDTTNPPTIYFKQLTSDGNHDYNKEVQSVIMSTQTQTVEVSNPSPKTVTFELKDANYENLTIANGVLTLNQ